MVIHRTTVQTVQKVLKYWTQNIKKYTMGVYDVSLRQAGYFIKQIVS